MTTFAHYKKQNGSVIFNGVEYAITQAAVADNYGTDGDVRYYSPAIDAAGNEYSIAWEATPEWDASNAIVQLELQGKDVDMAEIVEEFGVDEDFTPYALDDESYACDWDSPVAVTAK